MYEHIAIKNVIARKSHTCDWCNKTINKGEEYERQKFKYDGKLCEWHAHLACSRIATAIWDYADPDDGMDSDMFDESCADICLVFICPDCPKWNAEIEECDNDASYCLDKMDDFLKSHVLYPWKRDGYATYWRCRERK